MLENLDDRPRLSQRFEKLMSLGIWDDKIPQPDPQTLERIQRLNDEIENQIYELYLPKGREDPKVMQIKRQMYAESKEKSVGAKAQSKVRKMVEIPFLGKGVSDWLVQDQENTDRLKTLNLPSLPDLNTIANMLDTSPRRLIWLVYHEEMTDKPRYEVFEIPKGKGFRTIASPIPAIKVLQKTIKDQILDKLRFESYIHGFRKNHNIFHNAKEHAKAHSLVTIDIKDFFDTIDFRMVRRGFNQLGYSKLISTILALLTTRPEYYKLEVENQVLWNCSRNRFLPQGAPTSPGISNLIFSRLDYQMYSRSAKLGFIYTRYADDLTFSTTNKRANHKAILYLARKTLELHGFEPNPKKVKVLLPHHQQEVTGLIINSGKPMVPRVWRRRLRAAVHQFRFIEDKEIKKQEYHRIMGSIQHLRLTHPRKAKQYQIEIDRYYDAKL